MNCLYDDTYVKWLKMRDADKTQKPEKRTESEPSYNEHKNSLLAFQEFLIQAKR